MVPDKVSGKLKTESGKLRVSECVEVYLHTKRAEAGSIARSAVKVLTSECVEVYLHTKRAEAGSIARSAVKTESLHL